MRKHIRILAALLAIILLSQIQFTALCERTEDSIKVSHASELRPESQTRKNDNEAAAKSEETQAAEEDVCPEPTATSEAAVTPEPSATPEATEPLEQTATTESIYTPKPSDTPEPTDTTEPTGAPEATAAPEPTGTPEPTDTPEVTDSPEATATPEPITDADITATPEAIATLEPTPASTPDPEIILEPFISSEPYETIEPEASLEPEVTEIPGQGIIIRKTYPSAWYGKVPTDGLGMPIPMLFQGDYKEPLCIIDGKTRTVASSGCGPTSMSMIIAYLTGNTTQTPYTLFKQVLEFRGYYGAGVNHDALSHLAEEYGIHSKWISNDAEQIIHALAEGKPVIAHMGPGIFTKGGHYLVLRGLTKEGLIVVNDPASRYRTGRAYPVDVFIQQARMNDCFMVCWTDSMPEENDGLNEIDQPVEPIPIVYIT